MKEKLVNEEILHRHDFPLSTYQGGGGDRGKGRVTQKLYFSVLKEMLGVLPRTYNFYVVERNDKRTPKQSKVWSDFGGETSLVRHGSTFLSSPLPSLNSFVVNKRIV